MLAYYYVTFGAICLGSSLHSPQIGDNFSVYFQVARYRGMIVKPFKALAMYISVSMVTNCDVVPRVRLINIGHNII